MKVLETPCDARGAAVLRMFEADRPLDRSAMFDSSRATRANADLEEPSALRSSLSEKKVNHGASNQRAQPPRAARRSSKSMMRASNAARFGAS